MDGFNWIVILYFCYCTPIESSHSPHHWPHHYSFCRSLRIEKRFNELLSTSLLRHHKPEEGIHSRMGGEEIRDFWEVQTTRMRCRERIMESREVSNESYPIVSALNDWQQLYQLHWWGKWPKQWNSQLSSSFYHLQQKFKGTSIIVRA